MRQLNIKHNQNINDLEAKYEQKIAKDKWSYHFS